MAKITAELAHKLFLYNPSTGILYWRISKGKIHEGQEAGHSNGNGYLRVGYNYRIYQVTSIIWLLIYGHFPKLRIDHKNLNNSDNRLDNIREATASQNAANCHARIRNGTCIKGVFFDQGRNKYLASIMINKKTIFLGRFETKEEAAEAYNSKAKELFGEFAR